MKKTTGITIFIFWAVTVAILVTGFVFVGKKQNTATQVSSNTTSPSVSPIPVKQTKNINTNTKPVMIKPSQSVTNGQTTVKVIYMNPTITPKATNPTSTITPTIVPIPTRPSIGFFLAEVAKHNASSDCWTVVYDNVYNITGYISLHPGGRSITKICGIDGTQAFESVSKHSSVSLNQIKPYLLGPLSIN